MTALQAPADAATNFRWLRDQMESALLGQRNQVARAIKGEIKRPPDWFESQKRLLTAYEAFYKIMVIIERDPQGFRDWAKTNGAAASATV